MSQEERLAAQAAADEGEAPGTRAAAALPEEEEAEAQAVEEEGSAAGMLQSAVDLLDQAQALLDEAEEQARHAYACWCVLCMLCVPPHHPGLPGPPQRLPGLLQCPLASACKGGLPRTRHWPTGWLARPAAAGGWLCSPVPLQPGRV